MQNKENSLFNIILILTLIAGIIFIAFRMKNSNVKELVKNKSVLVSISKAQNIDITVYLSAIGTVTSERTVQVKSQVSGGLTKILFQDGQKVKAGELLAEIDARPYQAALTQYEGQLMRDMALLENAKIDLERYKALSKKNSISKQVFDTQVSVVNQYEGTVIIDIAQVENAKVNLSYCHITSPFDGQIGLNLIDEGNIIQTDTNIALINTLDPITVIFSVAEGEISKIFKAFNADKNLEVLAYDQDQNEIIARGNLLAIDNQIDNLTGSIKLKAKFDNKDNKLFPNQFVNIKLMLEILKDSLIVPESAIQYGPKGSFVFKIVDNKKVKITSVKLGQASNGNIIVKSGLSLGDNVVIEGADKLIDGALVEVNKDNEHI